MNHIIDNLYLGSYTDSYNFSDIFKYEINKIINVSRECENKKNDLIRYYKFNINDQNDIDKSNLDFICEIISLNPSPTLIHCSNDKKRSICFILYYLMKQNNYSLVNAIDFIKLKIPNLSLSSDYIKLLCEFDTSFDFDNYFEK